MKFSRWVAGLRPRASRVYERDVLSRPDAGVVVGAGGAAARDGVRHCLRADTAGRHLLRHRHRVPDLGPRRVPYQIGGPTGAFVVVVAGIVAEHGVERPLHVHDDGGRPARDPRRHGNGQCRQVPPAAGRHRIHERHRRAHREHADQGLLRPATCRSYPRSSPRAWSPWRETLRRSPPPATIVAVCALAGMIVLRRLYPRIPGTVRRARGRHGRGRVPGARRRNHRLPLRRHSFRTSATHPFRPSRRSLIPVLHPPGPDRGDARCDRVADVGRRCGSHERRPSQPEHRARRPGDRQHRLADLRRAASDRRDRADRDQYPQRRAHAGCRHDARRRAADRPAGGRTARAVHSRCRCSRRSC